MTESKLIPLYDGKRINVYMNGISVKIYDKMTICELKMYLNFT